MKNKMVINNKIKPKLLQFDYSLCFYKQLFLLDMINRDSEASEDIRNIVQQPLVSHSQITQVQEVKDQKPKNSRLQSLDVYRGFTILGMITADHLDGLDGAPWWLVHPDWNGFTCADLVFPAFLFIMGVAIPLAVSQSRPLKLKNILRVFELFAVGLFLNIIEQQFDFEKLRILGILQRMSVCYGIVLFIHWITDYGKNQFKKLIAGLFMIAIVIIYVALMLSWQDTSINCYRSNNLDPYCNFAGYVDRAVFTEAHIMQKTDPEGIISTMTATFTTYIGYCFGLMILKYKNKQEILIKNWLLFGIICLIPIYPCSLFMPFNKRLYTITFLFGVLSTSATVLTLFLLLIDYLPKLNKSSATIIGKITTPLKWAGMNPLAIFITLQFVQMILSGWIEIGDKNPYIIFYEVCFLSWMSPTLASLVYVAVYAAFYLIVGAILFKYNLFLRL